MVFFYCLKFTHGRDQHPFTPMLPEAEAFGQTHTIGEASVVALFEKKSFLFWLYMQRLLYFRFTIWLKPILRLLQNTLIPETTCAVARYIQWVVVGRLCSGCRDDLTPPFSCAHQGHSPKHSVSTGCMLRNLHQTWILWAMYPTPTQGEHAGTVPRDSVMCTDTVPPAFPGKHFPDFLNFFLRLPRLTTFLPALVTGNTCKHYTVLR